MDSGVGETAVAGFPLDSGWNIYDLQQWHLPSPKQLGPSDAAQRSHFNAFFRAEHAVRHKLLRGVFPGEAARRVRQGLCQRSVGSVWLRLRGALQARIHLKRHVWAKCAATAQHRQEVLDGWLAYWQDAEAKAPEEPHGRHRGPKGP
eukprot:EG_transcript_42470